MRYFDHINSSSVEREILSRLNKEEPFSLVRAGDGEGAVLSYPDGDVDFHRRMIKVFFGKKISSDDSILLQDCLIKGLESADILGLPNPKQEEKFQAIYHSLHKCTLAEDVKFCRASIHRHIGKTEVLRRLLASVDEVALVTSRDVGEKIKHAFNLKAVHVVKIPAESASIPSGGGKVTSHFPEQYLDICNAIKSLSGVPVFIVGGGILGKLYCALAKETGGVALDLGSIFDIWDGRVTRRYMKGGELSEYFI